MPPGAPLRFGPYTLAGPQGPLLGDTQVVSLPPKALAVLWLLACQAGRVVTKAALLDAVWADTAVSEGVLTACLRTLRQALAEDARQPQYIATVHRLGYRFIAPVTLGTPTTSPGTPPASPRLRVPAPLPLLVGRAAEAAQLHTCFAQAQQGERQTVFVTGEAGVGKTTVVDAFVHQLAPTDALWHGRGQCIEHYGAGEAYLPLLEALGRLGREPGGERLIACLRQYAPTWLEHLPALLPSEALAAVQHQGQGATRGRMLRELAEALEALAAERPVVLVLEDLHWSDPSTVEALALLARRRDPARLLVLGTYRPIELILHDHPLKLVKQELAAHRQCVDLPLGGLSRLEVAAYVAQRGGALAGHEEMAAFVYRRTEGHPLFMVQVVDYLAQRALLQVPPQAGAGGGAGQPVDQVVPQGLQQLIETQIGQLEAGEQQVLEGGSVAGAEFVIASVAAGVQMAPEAVEAVCERLAQRGQFIADRGLVAWPDGTVSGRYGFRHALHQEVLYTRIGAGRRARLHLLIGGSEEAGYGTGAGERAAELAMHFERGRDYRRAVQYLQQAGENAAQRHAPLEVIGLLTRGLAVLTHLPDTPERAQHELTLHLHLGPALMATQGQAAPAVERTYGRAQELCHHLRATPQLIPTLKGLFWSALSRGALSRARELGEELHRLVQYTDDPMAILEAHEALGMVFCVLGEYAAARTHLDEGIALIDAAVQRALAFRYDVAPGVQCLAVAVHVLWFLGFPEQAMQRSQEALTLATTLAHFSSLAQAQLYAALLHHRCRDLGAVQAQADALLALATAQGLPLFVGFGTCLQGWVRTFQGQGEAGLAQMHQGLAAILATGQTVSRPLGLLLLAEATAHRGQVAEGHQLLADALASCEASGRGDLRVEVYRLQGEFLLRQTAPDAAQAEICFQQALALARRQQAKSWELRVVLSLSRLWQQQGKTAAAHRLLAEVYGWFTEGFATPDLHDARALLAALS